MFRLQKTWLYLLAACFCSSLAIAQDPSGFETSLQIRPRAELRHGYNGPVVDTDAPSQFFVSQRSRLGMMYGGEGIAAKLAVQDVRNWGQSPQLVVADGLFSVHEAWASFAVGEEVDVKVGRQEVVFDDARIFGNVDWAQQGRTHDLLRVNYANEISVSLLIGVNRVGGSPDLNYPVANYRDLQALHVQSSQENDLRWSALILNNGTNSYDTDGSVFTSQYSQTIGGNLWNSFGELSVHVAGYVQLGTDCCGRDLSAHYLKAAGKLKIDDLSVELGGEKISGDDVASADKNNAFTPFYGTNHKFNGHMDYFYVGNHRNSVGLIDIFLKGSMAYSDGAVGIDLHYFMTDQDVPFELLVDSGNDLGIEADVYWKHKVQPQATIVAGVSVFSATETMALLRTATDSMNYWAYVMVNITPSFTP